MELGKCNNPNCTDPVACQAHRERLMLAIDALKPIFWDENGKMKPGAREDFKEFVKSSGNFIGLIVLDPADAVISIDNLGISVSPKNNT